MNRSRYLVTALIALLVCGASGVSMAQDKNADNSGKSAGAAEKKVDSKVKELSGISIIGNKEAPKSLYIVPWKSSEVGVESDLVSSLMDDKLKPLDKEVFTREIEFYQMSLSDE